MLSVERFTTGDEVAAQANDTVYALTGGVWTSDGAKGDRVAAGLRLWTVRISDSHPRFPQAPRVGFGRSWVGGGSEPEGPAEYPETEHTHADLAPEPSRWLGAKGARR